MNDENTENQKINPRARQFEIGIKSLRTITLWPLAVGEQLGMTTLIANSAAEFFKEEDQSEAALFSFGLGKINQHVQEILQLVLDDKEKAEQVLMEIDNDQLVAIVELIFVMNFEKSVKNAVGLFERIKENMFPSERPSPTSVKDTLTDSPISIQEGLEMEDSQEVS